MKQEVYSEVDNSTVSPLVQMSLRELVAAIVCGIGVGLMVSALMLIMNKYLFGTVLCRTSASADCSQAPLYSLIVSMVIGAIAGVVGLARLRVFRPLLTVIASAVALWGIEPIVFGMPWYWAILSTMFLFGICYGLFTWISRVRSFILAVVLVTVLVVVTRLMLIS